jgi:hypothetical protein
MIFFAAELCQGSFKRISILQTPAIKVGEFGFLLQGL